MGINKVAFIVLAYMLLLPVVSGVVPSEEAIQAASTYLRQGEEASIVNQPYSIDGRQYFVVYFHPQTNPQGKNLIVVVDADTGQLVEDQQTLKKVYLFDYKLSFMQNFVEENQLSFQDLKTATEGGKNSQDQAETSLEQVERNLINTDENIASIQVNFNLFTAAVERLLEDIDAGLEAQGLFEREYTNAALEGVITHYNSTLKSLVNTVKTGDDYQRSVINKSNELTQEGVDQNLFKTGLQAAYDIGLDRFSSRSSLESASQEFSGINSQQGQRQVNDSIQSYLYRKQKIDSDNSVEQVRPSVEEILRKRGEVEECTSVADLERTWQHTLAAQSANQFTQVLGNATLVGNELDKVKTELDRCASSQGNSGENQEKDNTNIFIAVILLLLVGYFVWKFTRKKPEGGEIAPTAKGNLFGP